MRHRKGPDGEVEGHAGVWEPEEECADLGCGNDFVASGSLGSEAFCWPFGLQGNEPHQGVRL